MNRMKWTTFITMLLAPLAMALSEAEFKALYERTDKDAEACYALHKAYLEGDGVEKDIHQSQKWLLGAYELGKSGLLGELGAHPLRKQMKLNTKVKMAKVSEEVAREKGMELLNVLQDATKHISARVGAESIIPAETVKEVRRLLNAGADPNVYARRPGMQRWTPLACAAAFRDLKMIKLLIDAGADPAAHSYHAFISISSIDQLVRKNPNDKAYVEMGKQMVATTELMARYCNLKGYTRDGWSPLYYATNNLAVHMARIFLKGGAEVNVPQKPQEISGPVDTRAYYYQTGSVGLREYPLNCAVNHDCIDMVRLLLENGADPRLANSKGVDALGSLDYTIDWKTKANIELSGNEEEIRKMLQNPPTAKDKTEKPAKKGKKKKKKRSE